MPEEIKKDDRLSVGLYVLGFASFVPCLGLLFGLVSIIVGLVKINHKGWQLVALGIGGYIFTGLVLFITYQQMMSDSGPYAEQFQLQTQIRLTQVLQAVEKYKAEKGEYPDSLETLRRAYPGTEIVDTGSMGKTFRTLIKVLQEKDKSKLKEDIHTYVYVLDKSSGTYWLFSRGPDGVAYTADDIFPTLTDEEKSKFGYRQRPDAAPAPDSTGSAPVSAMSNNLTSVPTP